jgi:hypothetical protein
MLRDATYFSTLMPLALTLPPCFRRAMPFSLPMPPPFHFRCHAAILPLISLFSRHAR